MGAQRLGLQKRVERERGTGGGKQLERTASPCSNILISAYMPGKTFDDRGKLGRISLG